MKFPVYSGNISPLDSKHRGKLTWYDVPGRIHGVEVNSGDLIFGDTDGVVVIPHKLVEQVVDKALGKVKEENKVRKKLLQGQTLKRIFADHGIL